jgi:hypothetical protein
MVDDLEVRCYHEGCQWRGIEGLRRKHQRCCDYKPKNDVAMKEIPVVEISDLEEVQYVDADADSSSLQFYPSQ